MKNSELGFTLIEMLVVIAIIAILATLALPNYTSRNARLQIEEVLKYSEDIKPKIKDYHTNNGGNLPITNADALLAPPDKLISTLIKETAIENGAIHFTLGNNALSVLQNKVITLQPLVVTGNPTSPIDWSCAFSKIPEGMEAKGENKTTIETIYLPFKCNSAKTK